MPQRPDASRPMSGRTDVFAVGRGQYENIGDVILRRPLLDWARPAGRLHVYVGRSPDGYDDALGVQPGDRTYRSFTRWYRALVTSAAAGRAHTIYKPGEVQLTLIGMKEHLAMIPAAALVRLRGGSVSRIGVGARNFAPLPRALMWPSNALSSLSRWRDRRTAAYLGFGAAMPDLGFAEGASDADLVRWGAEGTAGRDLFVVSMRDDVEVAPRPYPDAAWFAGIRLAAQRLGLRLCVVTQVSVDDERSRRLAADLDAELVGWPALGGHREQERRLRAVYRRTAVAASDRLHVIIAALTEGAAAVGLQLDASDKISRHFEAIGIDGVGVDTTGLSAEDLAERIASLAARRGEMLARLFDARASLAEVRDELHVLLGVGPCPADGGMTGPVVYHVGRAGDVPGGMTQVVNAYLAWAFEHVTVDVLTSRGDPGDHLTALRRSAGAAWRLRRIARRGEPAVIVVHLSERGSFAREGMLARWAARLGLPVVAHLHGSEFADYERADPTAVRRVLEVCTTVIALSDESAGIAARYVGDDRVVVVPNAIPAGHPVEKGPVVVFGGVVSRRKGIDVLQDAWRSVSDAFPGWRLIVAGPIRDGDLVDRSLPGATFAGAVSHADLLRLLDSASVAILPSRDEAMPMFLLEAMARRAVMVSTTVGGIPALLDGGCGWLVPPGDAAATADALRSAMGDDAERAARTDAASRRFDRSFSAAAVFPRVERIWLDALAAARR